MRKKKREEFAWTRGIENLESMPKYRDAWKISCLEAEKSGAQLKIVGIVPSLCVQKNVSEIESKNEQTDGQNINSGKRFARLDFFLTNRVGGILFRN